MDDYSIWLMFAWLTDSVMELNEKCKKILKEQEK